jgi:hypothetical protein
MHYIIEVTGLLEAEVHGPYDSVAARDAAAQRIAATGNQHEYDALLWADIEIDYETGVHTDGDLALLRKQKILNAGVFTDEQLHP